VLIEFTNDFHNTHATVRVGADGWLSARQIRNLRARLCGNSNCWCSGETGARGPQTHGYYIAVSLDDKDQVIGQIRTILDHLTLDEYKQSEAT